ncbi:hypothetical protein D0T84_21300 [Dysgonomonas sp. 521]|uniref:hypothetical protein n=1 Tax=Dysgonomonas sp. 521 TaxID=2302932 RepID=UPI0013D05D8E|nr:hypothetical protein [Dysgonomonas sp. 521]NDV97413.1 hypothetical protein [Dysgonomonas sp. 521]
MNISAALDQYRYICGDVLKRYTAKLNKSFKTVFIETLLLYMVIPRKINFTQLGRYGTHCEQCFRQNFTKEFDWFSYNLLISERIFDKQDRKAIAIDPSYISKSGKRTPWIGYFWSGCAGAVKRGLEIMGIGLLNIDKHDCMMLRAVQSPDRVMPVTINNEITYGEWQEGSFWNVWLSFDKRDGRETVKQSIDFYLQEQKEYIFSKEDGTASLFQFETNYYNSTISLLKNTINLVINCLLYLSLPTEKIDIEKKYPENLPHNFNKKLKFSKNPKEQEKISKKIDQLGFSKINYIGQSYKRDYPSIFSNMIQQPH